MDETEDRFEDTQKNTPSTKQKSTPDQPLPIVVAMGASAGGLEALEAFFTHMPPLSGMIFIIIQHLAPQYKSALPELVQRYTEMPVKEAQNDMPVEPNTVYIIPPNVMLALFNGKLQLLGPTEDMTIRLPIDYFFRSLAEDMRERVVGVILSGTGSDGSLGLKAIKEHGGSIIVQEPSSALYDGMPLSAIATGLADFILPANTMPDKLMSFKRLTLDAKVHPASPQGKLTVEYLQQILTLVRMQTGHDFSHYKETTIRRRIERLMAMNQMENIVEYVRYLENNTIGIQILFRDLLIGVTNFFRDKDAFDSLQHTVVPQLFQNRRANQAIRVWVAGCSTGEEAYSIAILLREHMLTLKQEYKVQIFATDIDDQAINFARIGLYATNIALDVPEPYLQQYFIETTDGYQVVKSLREMLVFAEHNVIKDPPFTKLDLISCRNLLIYMDSELQGKALSHFRFALINGGFLLLGSSESLGTHEREFTAVDAAHRIYQSSRDNSRARLKIDLSSMIRDLPIPNVEKMGYDRTTTNLGHMIETMLLNEWTPTCVIINDQGHLRYVHGPTGKYLEIASGSVDQLDIVRSARDSLRIPLTTAIYRAITQQREIYEPGIRVTTQGEDSYINLIVRPLPDAIGTENLLAVIFEDIEILRPTDGVEVEPGSDEIDEYEQKYRLLQQELHDTHEYLQATIEELRSTNEEMQSTNEELQSVNEELETSQEELNATNEELLTVNNELENNIKELNAVNNDLINTFNSISTGIILLDTDFNVRRFNAAAIRIFKLIDGDVGRPMAHIFSELDYTTLLQDAEKVYDTLIPYTVDVQAKNGDWFTLQIRPYRTVQNTIKGVVVSFNDISLRKRTEAIQEARILAENIFDTVREPLLLLDANMNVVSANHAFYKSFQLSAEETLTCPLTELGQGTWAIPELIQLIETVFEKNTVFQDYEMRHNFPGIGLKKLRVNTRQIRRLDSLPIMALMAIEVLD